MGAIDKLTSDGQDYRAVHLEKGSKYDANLAESPFDAYMAAWERKHLPAIVKRFYPQGPQRYLDFACGTGRITQVVAPHAGETVGVDISPTMLEHARLKCPGASFVEADLTKASVDLGRFDLVTSFRFFGNAQQDLRAAVLPALNRALKPGGYLIINSHRNPRSIAALMHGLTGGEPSGMDLHWGKLKGLLRRHGFEIAQVLPIAAWMVRFKLQAQAHDPRRAARLERRYGHPIFASVAPDVLVVARKLG